MPAAPAEFVQRCALAGHDPDAADAARGVSTYPLVPSLEAFRPFLGSSMASRVAREATFFHPQIRLRQRLGQGIHDRGEASLVSVAELSDTDRDALAHHLPMPVKAISARHVRVPQDTTWDVSVRGDVWGLDDIEELYVVLNLDVLELGPGARLVVRGNVLIATCQQLIAHPGAAIEILPTPFSVDLRGGPMDGARGCVGQPGADGERGWEIPTEHSAFGLIAREPVESSRLHGHGGVHGAEGCRGARGRNGGMCKLAEISIRAITGSVRVFAQAGAGGDGGDGGPGGCGGSGGAGAQGARLLTGTVPDGLGGGGGNGGDGGRGGSAGHGGIASNIYVNVPAGCEARVVPVSLPSSGGRPGSGGIGGIGGRGGAGAGAARAGVDGRPGHTGGQGRRGRSRPGPWIFVNDKPTAGERQP